MTNKIQNNQVVLHIDHICNCDKFGICTQCEKIIDQYIHEHQQKQTFRPIIKILQRKPA